MVQGPGYRVEFPQAPQESSESFETNTDGPATRKLYRLDQGDTLYRLQVTEYPAAFLAKHNLPDEAALQLQMNGWKNESQTDLPGGRQWRFLAADQSVLDCALVVTDNRVIELLVHHKKDVSEAEAARFLSFQRD